jgi:hypothetical protein
LEDLPEGYGSGRFGHGMYTRTPGEALARLSAARLGMMPESRVNDPAFTALRDLENLDLEALTELRSPSDVPRSFGLEPPLAGSLPVPPSVIAGIYNNILGAMVPQRQRELEAVFDNPPEGVTRTELIDQYRQMLEEDMVQAMEPLLRSYLQPGPWTMVDTPGFFSREAGQARRAALNDFLNENVDYYLRQEGYRGMTTFLRPEAAVGGSGLASFALMGEEDDTDN